MSAYCKKGTVLNTADISEEFSVLQKNQEYLFFPKTEISATQVSSTFTIVLSQNRSLIQICVPTLDPSFSMDINIQLFAGGEGMIAVTNEKPVES